MFRGCAVFAVALNYTQMEVRQPRVFAKFNSLPPQLLGLRRFALFERYIAEMRQRLRVLRIIVQFILELDRRLVIAPILPKQISEAEMRIRRVAFLGGDAKFLDCLLVLILRIVSLS